jgi:parallel beta-helix repeat protein
VNKKTCLAAAFISLLLFSLIAGLRFVTPASANPVLMPEETPPGIQIKSDGSVEGTDRIQRDGSVYTFTGDISNTIVILCDGIVLDGAGYTLRGSGNGSGVFVQERNNVVIRNVRISNFSYGIKFTWRSYDSSKTLRSNKVSGNTIGNNTYGIVFGDFSEGNEVSANYIIGNSFGVGIASSSNSVFRNNRFDNNQYAVIDDSSYPNDIDTTNTINGKPIYYWVNQHDKTVPSDAGWVVLKNSSGITVQNLNLEGNGPGILLYYTDGSTISGNVVTNNWGGITLGHSSNNTISGNRVTNNNGNGISLTNNNGSGISLHYSHNNVISGNYIAGNNWEGISIEYDSTNNAISKNEIAANAEDGVSFGSDSISNIVTENNVVGNGGNGIFFINIKDFNVTGNNVTLNKGCGIGFGYGPDGMISGNCISRNGLGIWLSNAVENNITLNTIGENDGWGIRLEGSHENNIIHHNNFIDNNNKGIQASITEIWVYPDLFKRLSPGQTPRPPQLVAGAANAWDDGSEGNYWSDYTSRYPSASEIDKTGVGDTPYSINENNMDRYPLMKPVTISGASTEPTASPPPTNTTAPEQRQNTVGTALPIEYSYAAILMVAIAGVTVYLFLKRKLPVKSKELTN